MQWAQVQVGAGAVGAGAVGTGAVVTVGAGAVGTVEAVSTGAVDAGTVGAGAVGVVGAGAVGAGAVGAGPMSKAKGVRRGGPESCFGWGGPSSHDNSAAPLGSNSALPKMTPSHPRVSPHRLEGSHNPRHSKHLPRLHNPAKQGLHKLLCTQGRNPTCHRPRASCTLAESIS